MTDIAPQLLNTPLYPIALLIDDLRHEDVQTRLNSVQQLEHIALALGPLRTRNELIPYLMECADENDAVLSATAEKLGRMIDLVGGPDFVASLVKPLEDLLGIDESVVRDKATASLRYIMNSLPRKQVEENGIPLVLRLASNDWFVARCTACNLIPDIAHRAFSDELIRVFLELCSDDTPMVRRAAMGSIASLAKETPSSKQRDLLDALRRLARDDQDSVRILTIPTAMTLARDVFKNPQDSFNALFPEIRSCVDDQSWRVRVTVANSMDDTLTHVTPPKNHNQVFETYNKLLSDPEIEVRTIAVSKLPVVCGFKPDRTLLNLIAQNLNKLIRDDSDQVRAALAEALARTAPVLGAALTADVLLHLILKSLRDQSTNVRLKVIANIEHISALLKLDEMAPCLMPAITELATDRQWRTRLAILEYSSLLATHLATDVFVAELLPVIIRWLSDPVFKVREAAASTAIPQIAKIVGAKDHVVPEIVSLGRNSNYLYRISALVAIRHLVDVVPQEVFIETLLPLLTGLVTDSVPNVRFNVAKTLHAVYCKVPKRVAANEILSSLRNLVKDQDPDVRFSAKEAVDHILTS
jgi:serine/threonine-protein phosphatase 2A regulatory subunit A